VTSRAQFAKNIENIARTGEEKILRNGRTTWWDTKTGTVVIYDPRTANKGTCFKPAEGKA
jgi:hypothetical protein